MPYVRVGIHQKAYRDLHVIIDGEIYSMEEWHWREVPDPKLTRQQTATLDKLGGGEFEILIAEEGGVQINLK